MGKRLMFIVIVVIMLVRHSVSYAQEECIYDAFLSPVWASTQNLIAVTGCSGIQFYNNSLQPIRNLEIIGIRGLSISPNGRWIAAASTEETVFIEVDTLEVIFTIASGDPSMQWHPSASWLVLYDYGDESLLIIDADSQEIIYQQTIDHLAANFTWDSNGYISYVGQAHIDLYQWLPGETSEFIQEFPVPMQYGIFQANTWSPDSSKFIFIVRYPFENWGSNPFGIWDATENTYISPTYSELDFSLFMGIAWHPSSDFVAISTWKAVYILDATTLDILHTYPITEIEPSYEIRFGECRVYSQSDVNQFIAWNSEGTHILVSSLCRLAIFPTQASTGVSS